ncbi:MAG: DUF4351 domain-containing protein [Planctomycetota bacterium]
MSVGEKLREQGRAEGLARGREEGRVEGHREILRQLLEARFGALSPDIARRIDEAPIESLQRWGRSLLTAKGLGDVFTE